MNTPAQQLDGAQTEQARLLLAVDTATATASVAVYDIERQRLLVESAWQARRRHTQDLMATIQQTLRLAQASATDLTALAVTTGPGSFTGVRIGISAIKGLGLGLTNTPHVVGLPTLCVTAAPWIGPAGSISPPVTICAFIQAGRGRYNWTWFGPHDQLSRPGRTDHDAGTGVEFTDALAERNAGPVWLVGELDDDLQSAAASIAHVCVVDAVSAMRRAGHLARLAALHLAAGVQDDLAALQPLYLRNP